MTTKIFASTLIISSILCFSCSDSDAKKTENQDDIVDTVMTDTTSIAIIEDDQEVSYKLPSALQIAYVFKKSGSAFIPTLVNSNINVNRYNISPFKRATNFGVYSADLAYCIFNKKYQESKNYLKSLKEIGTELGLNNAFEDDNVVLRFDKNIANEDSIIKIVSSVQLKTDVLLEKYKHKHITTIIFTGAWVESVYIASEVYSKDKNIKALNSLLEQLLLAETIIKALKANLVSEPEISKLIEAVGKIKEAYDSIAAVKLAKEKDEEIDFALINVTESEFKAISSTIIALRKEIID